MYIYPTFGVAISKMRLTNTPLRQQRKALSLAAFSTSNGLACNPDKTEVVHLCSCYHSITLPGIDVGGSISPTRAARDLGVLVDSHLTLSKHINSECKSAFFSISNIGRIRKYLDRDNCERLVHASISSKLDSCISLLTGLPDKEISKLQRMQNAAMRLIVGAAKNEHMSPVLQQLHWLPIKFRIDFKILMLTYKTLHNQAPDYISELLTLYRPSHALSSSCQMLLAVPKTKTKLHGDKSFAASAPRLWNALPVGIKNSESLNIFKSKVKTHLFRQCYRV